MKRVGVSLFSFLLLVSSGAAFAQSAELSLLASQERIAVDSVVMIVVDIGGVRHLHAYSVDVAYDTGLVRYLSLQRLPFFSGQTFFASNVDSTRGKVVINEAILGISGRSGEGGLALIRFLGARPGTASFRIGASALRDSVNTSIPVRNGGTSVSVYVPDG